MKKTVKTIVAAAAASFMCAVPTVASFANVPAATSITASAYYIPNSCEDIPDDFIPNLSYYNGVYDTGVYSGAHVDYKKCPGGVEVYRIDVADSRIKIPARVKINDVEYKVIRIGNGAFKDKNGTPNGMGAALTKITFSTYSELEEIGDDAFQGCTKLKEIKLPKTLKKIGNHAFKGSGMEMVSYTVENRQPVSSLETIGDEAFMDCTQLSKIYLPATITNVNTKAFYNTGITLVNFAGPNSNAVVIGDSAFSKCSKLNSISTDRKATGSQRNAFNESGYNLRSKVKKYSSSTSDSVVNQFKNSFDFAK